MRFEERHWARLPEAIAGSGLSEWRLRQLISDGTVRSKVVDRHRILHVGDILKHLDTLPDDGESRIASLGDKGRKKQVGDRP